MGINTTHAPDTRTMFEYDFMVNAFAGVGDRRGAGGVVGYFLVLRGQTFAGTRSRTSASPARPAPC